MKSHMKYKQRTIYIAVIAGVVIAHSLRMHFYCY